MNHILVIDDESDICLLLERFLGKNGYKVTVAYNGQKGLAAMRSQDFDLIISDFRLPDINGLEFLKEAKAMKPDCKVIIITGYSDIRMAVELMKYGALDYVTKPLYPEELLNTVKESLAKDSTSVVHNAAASTTGPASKEAGKMHKGSDAYLEGDSAYAKEVSQNINLVAPTSMSVIILGETGTGKEFAARRIHELSDRCNKAFVAIDCGALPKDIAGSEFFGHEQGAFTGAVKSKDGKFKAADGGTLFLDEIGNLSYEIQLKLLRVLQERKYTRIGGNKDVSIDVRILTATNENLRDAVADGRFREDLYYRLNEFTITLAPIRERADDLEAFTQRFIAQANESLKKKVTGLSADAWNKFRSYSWPGNLRELRNVLKRAVLLTQGDIIQISSLPEEIAFGSFADQNAHSPSSFPLKQAAEEAERDKIVKVLSQSGNNKSKAARLLNIDRKTLYNKLKTYGI